MTNYKFVDVVAVEDLDYTEDVYDITVEDNHNFFANGVVVHNCLGGKLSGTILLGTAHGLSHEQILSQLKNEVDRFTDAVGINNFNLELQFNKLDKQHVVNRYLIDLHRSTGVPLLVTCDSHYPDPSKWQARELYKKLGWMGAKLDATALPKFEDLKCELYPKNAAQLWEEYKIAHAAHDFYRGSEELVRDAIERTHDIAWQECDDTWVDVKAKLPRFGTPEKTALKQLVEILKERMAAQGLSDNPEYIARLKEELEVVKAKQFEDYFLTLYKIFQKASKRAMIGPGRGSGTGSLINYVLGITNVDPIKYGLLFSRFINMGRKGFPDVDTDISDRDVLIEEAKKLFGDDAVIPVSNFNLLKLKSLVKDLGKIFGVPFEEVNELTSTLQQDVEPLARGEDVEKSVFVLMHDDCMKYSEKYRNFMSKYPQVCEHIETLFMQNRSCFTKDTQLMTEDGPKTIDEIDPENDKVAYVDYSGKICYNDNYEVHYKGKQKVYKIMTDDHRVLFLTGDHEVLTQDGYKRVDEVDTSDVLIDFLE